MEPEGARAWKLERPDQVLNRHFRGGYYREKRKKVWPPSSSGRSAVEEEGSDLRDTLAPRRGILCMCVLYTLVRRWRTIFRYHGLVFPSPCLGT